MVHVPCLQNAKPKKAIMAFVILRGRHDIQHKDTRHNVTQHKNTQHNYTQLKDTQHNDIQQKGTQHNDIQDKDIQQRHSA